MSFRDFDSLLESTYEDNVSGVNSPSDFDRAGYGYLDDDYDDEFDSYDDQWFDIDFPWDEFD